MIKTTTLYVCDLCHMEAPAHQSRTVPDSLPEGWLSLDLDDYSAGEPQCLQDVQRVYRHICLRCWDKIADAHYEQVRVLPRPEPAPPGAVSPNTDAQPKATMPSDEEVPF